MALARALYENGDADEACALLDGVLITSPDNLLANRIMAEICIQRGEADRARVAIRRILAVDPADKHCTELLKSIEALVPASPKPVPPKPAAPPEPAAPAPFAPVPVKISPPAEAEVPVPPVNVRTATLAELYLRQGHAAEALEVYRELLVRDPDNGAYAQRARELGSRMAVKSAPQDPAVIKRKVLNTLLTRIGERRRSA
jgi:cytochrome c-type biogenesis protein CcmH/NrfG